MPSDKRKDRAQKKRQRQARKALETFLAKLRDACKTIEKVEQWLEHIHALQRIAGEYADALPTQAQTRLRSAIQVAEGVTEGFDKACQVLQSDIEGVIALLPLSIGTLLIAALIGAAAVVGAATAITVATAAPLTIENQDCGDIIFPPIPIPAPGLELPNHAIRAGEHGDAKIPFWVAINVDATVSPPALRTLAGPFPIPGNPKSIRLAYGSNVAGDELLNPGQITPVNLAGRTNLRLIVSCR